LLKQQLAFCRGHGCHPSYQVGNVEFVKTAFDKRPKACQVNYEPGSKPVALSFDPGFISLSLVDLK
jgi:hypothetical protein